MVCWANKIPGCSFTVAPITYATLPPRNIFLQTKQMSFDAKAQGLFVASKKGPDINMPSSSLTGTSIANCGTRLEACVEEWNENDENSGRRNSMTTCQSFPPVSGKKIDKPRRHSDTVLCSEENFCSGEPTHMLVSSVESATSSLSASSVPRFSADQSNSKDKSSAETTPLRERKTSLPSTSTVSSVDYATSIRYWPPAIINNETRVSASAIWVGHPESPTEPRSPSSQSSTAATSPNGSIDDSMIQMTLDSELKWCTSVDAFPGIVTSNDVNFGSTSPYFLLNHDHNFPTAAITAANSASTPVSEDADSPKVTQNGGVGCQSVSESLQGNNSLLNEQSGDDLFKMKDLRLVSQLLDKSRTSNSHEDETETTLTKFGILKETVPLKISEQQSKKRKNVRFLDSVGQPLTRIKEFNESEELMEKIELFEKSERNLLKNDNSEDSSQPLFRFAFTQPAANYLQFRQKLERCFVSLENVHFQGPRQFCGTVKVKNCAFEKKVFLKITFNSWESSSDIQCLYVDNGLTVKAMYDTFKFEVLIPSSWHTYHKIQFCCCFLENGREHWDNNDGNNYSVVSNLSEVNEVRYPVGGPYSPLFSFWRAHTSDDELHPYW